MTSLDDGEDRRFAGSTLISGNTALPWPRCAALQIATLPADTTLKRAFRLLSSPGVTFA